MLIDDLGELRSAAEKIRQAEQLGQHAHHLSTIDDGLSELISLTKPLAACKCALEQHGCELRDVPVSGVSGIRKTVGEWRQMLNGSPSEFVESVNLASLREPTRKILDAIEKALWQVWRSYSREKGGASRPEQDTIDALRKAGLVDVANDLREAARTLAHMVERLPRDAAELEKFDVACQQTRDAWSKVGLNEATTRKLGRMTSTGLPLDELDDELLKWIRDKGLERRFRIRLT